MMRPRGRPPTPRARSTASDPVESVSTFILALLPRRMIEPSPNCLVIEERASSMFLSRAWATVGEAAFVSAALAGGAALDMAERRTLVDALISNRRDSKIRSAGDFVPVCGPGQETQGEPALRASFRENADPRQADPGPPGPFEADERASARAAAARSAPSLRWRSRRRCAVPTRGPPVPRTGRRGGGKNERTGGGSSCE